MVGFTGLLVVVNSVAIVTSYLLGGFVMIWYFMLTYFGVCGYGVLLVVLLIVMQVVLGSVSFVADIHGVWCFGFCWRGISGCCCW